jgi:hypothetical protein
MKAIRQLACILLVGIATSNPAKASPYFLAPVNGTPPIAGVNVVTLPVNLNDIVTLDYSYTFNHGDPPTKSNSWTYRIPNSFDLLYLGTAPQYDPINQQPTYETYQNDTESVEGTYSVNPLAVPSGAFLVHGNQEPDFSNSHMSVASFAINPGTNKVVIAQGDPPVYQAKFAFSYYDPQITPSCVYNKFTCSDIYGDLQASVTVNSKAPAQIYVNGVALAANVNSVRTITRAKEVPGPFPLLGAVAFFRHARKLRKVINAC